MKVLWIGGSHPRHLYFAQQLAVSGLLAAAVIEQREQLVPEPPVGLSAQDSLNFVRHFSERQRAEEQTFGRPAPPEVPLCRVTADSLNSDVTAEFVKSHSPDVVLIFGSGLIKGQLLQALPSEALNLHLGLSPRYRGAATLFWPFYFMEPTYAGSTFHYITAEVDAGDVVHQTVPTLFPSDGIHDVACRTVVASAHDAVRLLQVKACGDYWNRVRQRGTGKKFLESDFRPAHLRLIYNLFDNDMVGQYLKGHLSCSSPRLVTQFPTHES